MAHDEEALRLLDENVGMRWMAPSGDYMAYLPDAVQAIEGAGVLQAALAQLATDSRLAIEVWE
ncbi:hypothetical protein EG328_003482 [Venturia inaequalis]|uniref:Uncharacterized protein n=1 Tax=Venturia inaequalis TaxID=5025 RepID=A0A8H3UTK7_VENIN|nr:hypothetical protein EG328_003482 [Venturia inaequalis]